MQLRELSLESCMGLLPDPDPDQCAASADLLLDACLLRCNEEPLDCDLACGERARDILESCLQNGGSRRECYRRTNDFLERCLAGGSDDGNGELTCDESCEGSATLLEQRCRERGGGMEECAARAERHETECRERCDDSEPEPTTLEGHDPTSDDLICSP